MHQAFWLDANPAASGCAYRLEASVSMAESSSRARRDRTDAAAVAPVGHSATEASMAYSAFTTVPRRSPYQ